MRLQEAVKNVSIHFRFIINIFYSIFCQNTEGVIFYDLFKN
jgi:hypothetical protein